MPGIQKCGHILYQVSQACPHLNRVSLAPPIKIVFEKPQSFSFLSPESDAWLRHAFLRGRLRPYAEEMGALCLRYSSLFWTDELEAEYWNYRIEEVSRNYRIEEVSRNTRL